MQKNSKAKCTYTMPRDQFEPTSITLKEIKNSPIQRKRPRGILTHRKVHSQYASSTLATARLFFLSA
ncbi:hypothetical protein LENED_006911 [Lentinula edodes]|uniref:Uncharacterized protein n=1 Tax=Lentinula edodes TaxID=5353 RepID=A0A1Q3ECZ1_LENED|nr:hypothetical protein LENED_006911 [Lentinula edodes]